MRITVISILLILAGCQTPASQDGRPVILTSSDHLYRHVGELVTVQGMVSDAKVPQIIGVDVSEAAGLEGQYAEATGVLFRWTVTAEAHAGMQVMGNMVAVRGPGTYYSVVSPAVLAPARPVLDSPAGPLGDTPLDGTGEEIVEIETISVDEVVE